MDYSLLADVEKRRARLEKLRASKQKRKASEPEDKTSKSSVKQLKVKQTQQRPCSASTLPEAYPGCSSVDPPLEISGISEQANSSVGNEMILKRSLSAEDRETIMTLENFYSLAFVRKNEGETFPEDKVEDFINTTKETVQKLIKYIKCVNDFAMLDQKCQILILKARMLSSVLLRAAFDYQKEYCSWNLVHREKPLEFSNFKKALGPQNADVADKVVQMHASLQEKFGQDSKLYALLHLALIFNPCTPNLQNRQTIADIQIKYITLLKHYLESKFSYHMSKTCLPYLLQKLNFIDELSEDLGEVLSVMQLKDVDPLMIEVLSLQSDCFMKL